MVDTGSAVAEFPTLVVTIILGATILVIVYISSLFKSQKGKKVQSPVSDPLPTKEPLDHGAGAKHKKKQHTEKWSQKLSKQNFTHQWMMTSLKGHTGQVHDMDFSSNGKFLATCAEDGSSGTSSGSEGNKENNPQSAPTLSRRQKKNRTRRDDGSPGTVKKKEAARQQREKTASLISKQLSQLNLPDRDLPRFLLNYTLCPQQLLQLGFPVESSLYPGRAIIYKESEAPHHVQPRYYSGFDVNAREFVPKEGSFYVSSLINVSDNFDKSDCNMVKILPERGEERRCARCSKGFFVSNTGEYLSTEQCLYHWGKLQPNKEHPHSYSCCKGKPNTRGCTVGKLHVWNGIGVGVNGPLEGFVRTRSRKTPPPDGNLGVYALDCEMCYTNIGLELSRVTVVAPDGRLVYDTLVRPDREIIDYNSRFSGISARDYVFPKNYKSLREVQNDLMGFINADTILIGHGLDNDLRALKMIHTTCVDTSVIFPHHFGLPYRRSLKSLATLFLKTTIQTDPHGHDSSEDARTCIGLMLYRIEKDFRAAFSA